MLTHIIVMSADWRPAGASIILEYASGRSRTYPGTAAHLRRLSPRLDRLLIRHPDLFRCRPFYDTQPGYVIYRR